MAQSRGSRSNRRGGSSKRRSKPKATSATHKGEQRPRPAKPAEQGRRVERGEQIEQKQRVREVEPAEAQLQRRLNEADQFSSPQDPQQRGLPDLAAATMQWMNSWGQAWLQWMQRLGGR